MLANNGKDNVLVSMSKGFPSARHESTDSAEVPSIGNVNFHN